MHDAAKLANLAMMILVCAGVPIGRLLFSKITIFGGDRSVASLPSPKQYDPFRNLK
jgi:hypothetical protein